MSNSSSANTQDAERARFEAVFPVLRDALVAHVRELCPETDAVAWFEGVRDVVSFVQKRR